MRLFATLVATVSKHPGLFAFCRSLLENDFKALRSVIRHELRFGRQIRTLDLGCGPGTFADLFSDGDYVGADIDAPTIDHARQTRPGTYIVADARRLELPDDRFDQVLIHGLFRHLGDDDVVVVLREARRVLVPDGRALLIEDIAPVSKRNVIGRFLRHMDHAETLRPADEYQRLYREVGWIAVEKVLRSGVWDYSAMVVTFD
jgi:ubiquinone/menaquinone biosynthesis C-methylase UbiE